MVNILVDLFLVIITVVVGLALGDIIAIGWYKRVSPKGKALTAIAGEDGTSRAESLGKGCFDEKPAIKPPTRIIATKSFVEKQTGPSCGGFATAYVLRHFGIDAKGMDVYGEMFKGFRGNVHLREVKKALKRRGLKGTFCKGSIDTIKEEIDKGYPVILFVRSKPGSYEFHFFVAVGYDEEHIYIADSAYGPKAQPFTESGAIPPYNRKIAYEDFLKIWNTGVFFMPTYRYTYISVRPEGVRPENEAA